MNGQTAALQIDVAPTAAPRSASADRTRIAITALILGALSTVVLAARWRVFFPLGSSYTGSRISNVGLCIQLAALIAGVVTINLARAETALKLLVAEGAVCLAAMGWAGLVYAGGLALWFGVLSSRWLGRARPLGCLALLVAMNACAWLGKDVAAVALMFSVTFTMRLLMLTWDRWQNDFEPMKPLDFLVYTMNPVLLVAPPYMAIIPFFAGAAAKVKPGLTRERARRAAKHLGLALLFGGVRAAMHAAPVIPAPYVFYWKFLIHVVEAAIFAHLLIPMLSLHGIDERLPLFRPMFATRFVHYWNRFQVHQKDAQVFLFFTPALLRLRRMKNRYMALVLATTWTMMVGNTLIHVAARYCFLPSLWGRVKWVLLANVIMTIGLSADMCLDEWRSRRRAGPPPKSVPRTIAAWAITQALAVVAATM